MASPRAAPDRPSGPVTLDPEVCHRALRARDARFDGRLFVGVVTTGVYCRPICPVPSPKSRNCRFFPSAAAAQAAGFRPCLRCRPEVAPHTPAWSGSAATVQRALRLIAEGVLDEGDVAGLAERVGVGERQLRRIFAKHVGASPLAVAQTNRLLLAKQLIDGSDLPMTQVALAAGYGSVRRFNDAIRSSWGRSPRTLRSRRGARAEALRAGTLLRLPFRRPYDWDGVLGFLGARAIPGVEEVRDGAYRRVVRLEKKPSIVEVRPGPAGELLHARLWLSHPVPLLPVAARLRRLFDLEADPVAIRRGLGRDPLLRAAARRHPGTRVPGAWDPFELAVRAILGQQVSVRAASTLAGRLVERFGRYLASPLPGSSLRSAFPTPAVLAEADLRPVGLPTRRAGAIRALARSVADGSLDLDALHDAGSAVAALGALPGIGPWTAGYVAMRIARDPDVLLADDLGVQRALGEAGVRPTPAEVTRRAEAWRPWRSYAVVLLWRGGAEAAKGSEKARAAIPARVVR